MDKATRHGSSKRVSLAAPSYHPGRPFSPGLVRTARPHYTIPCSLTRHWSVDTLVEGSTDAHVIETAFVSGPSGLSTRDGPEFYHEDCAISGTVAVCTNVFSSRNGQTTLPTLTTLATFVPVQVAAASGGGASVNGAARNLAAAAGSTLAAVGLGAAGALARAFL